MAANGAVAVPTLMDHIRELQARLFAVVLVFIVVSAAAYPFFDKIVNILVAPLGKEHELVYLTPAGAFGFIIQVCMYIGAIGALPMFVYQLYKFIVPAMTRIKLRSVIGFTLSSVILAAMGIVFAYVVSLPAALYFLTGFNLYHINPMLTIDSYFSFIMTYLLAGAVLFQIPLVMLITNSVTPLRPKELMGYQRFVIIGSFVVAAILSPTPDAINQALLASPMVIMYQVGIFLIWRKQRKAVKKAKVLAKKTARAERRKEQKNQKSHRKRKRGAAEPLPAPALAIAAPTAAVHAATAPAAKTNMPLAAKPRVFDVTPVKKPMPMSPVKPVAPKAAPPAVMQAQPIVRVEPSRPIDGFGKAPIRRGNLDVMPRKHVPAAPVRNANFGAVTPFGRGMPRRIDGFQAS